MKSCLRERDQAPETRDRDGIKNRRRTLLRLFVFVFPLKEAFTSVYLKDEQVYIWGVMIEGEICTRGCDAVWRWMDDGSVLPAYSEWSM